MKQKKQNKDAETAKAERLAVSNKLIAISSINTKSTPNIPACKILSSNSNWSSENINVVDWPPTISNVE